MRYQKTILYVALFVCTFLAVGGVASAVVLPLALPTGGNSLQVDVEIAAYGLSDNDTQSTTATGNFEAVLSTTIDSVTHAATVNGISFTEQPTGGISLSNMDYSMVGGMAKAHTRSVLATMKTPAPPSVVTSGSFLIKDHSIVLNSGTFSVDPIHNAFLNIDFDGYTQNLATDPIEGTTTSNTDRGTVSTSLQSWSGNRGTYSASVNLPVNFVNTFTDEGSGAVVTITVSGTLHGTGTFEQAVPEPGSIVMLLGMAASLAGYCCWKRRK